MATVIDALIITLGFDTKGLKQGQAESNKAIDDTKKKTKELTDQEKKRDAEIKKRHEENKKRTKETSDGFKTLSRDALAFFGVITTSMGMAKFIGDITNTNSQLYRTSNNLGTTTESLSAWGGAIEQAGGNAQEATNTMQMLSRSMTEMLLMGETANLPYFQRMNIDLRAIAQSAEPLPNLLKAINKAAQTDVSKAGRATAFNILQMMGIDYGTADVLVGTTKDLDAMLKRQKEIGLVGQDNARRSRELAREWTELRQQGTALGRNIEAVTTPALTEMLKRLMDFGKENPNVVAGIAGIAAVMLSSFAPVRVLLLGITGLLALDDFATWGKKGESVIGSLIESLDKLYDSSKKAWYAAHGAFDDKSKKDVDKKTSGILTFLAQVAKATPIGRPVSQVYDLLTRSDPSTIKKTGLKSRMTDKAKKEKRLEEMTESDIISHMMSKGWSRENAISIAANLKAESSLNPNAQNKNSSAFGYAQWLNSRQNVFKRNFGKSLKSASPREQLDFIDWELKNTHKNVGDQLKGMGVGEGAALLSNKYEVPSTSQFGLDAAAMTRARMAEKMAGVQPSYNNNASTSTSTSSTTIGQVNVYTQATDAQGIANAFPRALANQSESGAF